MRSEAARNGQMVHTLYAEYIALERPSEAISTCSALGADVNALAVVQILTLSYSAPLPRSSFVPAFHVAEHIS